MTPLPLLFPLHQLPLKIKAWDGAEGAVVGPRSVRRILYQRGKEAAMLCGDLQEPGVRSNRAQHVRGLVAVCVCVCVCGQR